MTGVAFRDGNNQLKYATTSSGTGAEEDPYVWQHNDPDGVEKLVELIDSQSAILDRLPPVLVANRVPVDGSGVTQPVSLLSLPLPSGASSETSLLAVKNALTTRITTINKGGTTPATPGEWKQVMTANINRITWRIHNPVSNTVNIEIGLKNDSGTFAISSLLPGGTDEQSLPNAITTEEIVIRSSSASVPYYAMEA